MIALSITNIVFVIFVFATAVQLLYYLFYYARLAWFKPKNEFHTQPPISVVICAKNEALKLHKSIPLFFQQEYPQYQIVVVNDCSVDESSDILEEFQKKYSNLHVVELNEDDIKAHDKKLALTLGIKGAKYEHLLLTDADCIPGDKRWIACMARNFSNEKEVVIGYGPYKKTSGFLNKLIRFDAYFIGVQYLSFSLAGNTYMGIGRNLAYTKSLFFRHKGFASQYHIQSGDDDLFINKVATKQNTIVELHASSFTYSDPKTSLGAWIKQKRRHLTTAKHYKSSHKIMLGLGSLTQYLFFISFIALLFSDIEPAIVLAIFGTRIVTQIIVLRRSMILLKESDLLLLSLFFEILLLIFYPIIYIGNAFVKKHKWK
jgi:glycosyltransferase involved in cell wall biosynthesis